MGAQNGDVTCLRSIQLVSGRETSLVGFSAFHPYIHDFSINVLGPCRFWNLPLQSSNNSAGRPALQHPSSNFRVGFSCLQSRPLTDSAPNPVIETSLGEHKSLHYNSGPLTSQLPEEHGRGRGAYLSCKWAKSSPYRVGSDSLGEIQEREKQGCLLLSILSRRRCISCVELQNFTILYLSPLWKAAVSIFGPQFPGLHTQKLKNWKKSGLIKGDKHSPLYPSSQLPLSPHGLSFSALSPPPNPRLGVRAAGTKLFWLWRRSPGTEQMQPKDNVLGGRERGRGTSFHLPRGHKAAPVLTGPREWEQTAIQFFPEPTNKLQKMS